MEKLTSFKGLLAPWHGACASTNDCFSKSFIAQIGLCGMALGMVHAGTPARKHGFIALFEKKGKQMDKPGAIKDIYAFNKKDTCGIPAVRLGLGGVRLSNGAQRKEFVG